MNEHNTTTDKGKHEGNDVIHSGNIFGGTKLVSRLVSIDSLRVICFGYLKLILHPEYAFSFVNPICENLYRLRNFPRFGISRTDLYPIVFVTRTVRTGDNGKRN